MKKSLKITLAVIAILALLFVAVVFLVSPVAKWYVETHCKELVGRRVTIEKLDIKLLSGRVDADNVVLYEANERDTFVSVGHLDTELELCPLLSQRVIVDSINVNALGLNVIRNRTSLNFDDMIAFFASKAEPSDTIDDGESGWSVVLNNISFSGGKLTYDDRTMHSLWTMRDIALRIPKIDLSGRGTRADLFLAFDSGGSLRLSALYDQPTMRYDVACDLEEYPVAGLLPLIQESLHVGGMEGLLSLGLHASGDINHILAFDLDGTIALENSSMTDTKGRQLAYIREIKTDIERVNIEQEYIIKLRECTIDGLKTRVEMFADGSHTFSDFVAAPDSTRETVSDSIRLDLSVGNLLLSNSEVTYVDHTLPEPFSLHLGKLRIKSPNFSLKGNNRVELFSMIQETGTLMMKWEGNPEAQNHDLSISVGNFNLKDITPYSLAFFGCPITDGKLSFRGQNVVVDNQLSGVNKLSLYRPKVDKKRKGIDAEFGKIPLKLAMAVLTDREGKAELDLPVSGNLDSPEFSYKKIILKALVNVIVKVAAAPFDLLVKGLGLKSDEVKEIKFSAWQHQFTPEQYDKLEKISQVLKEKPDMVATLKQEVNYEEGIKNIVANDFRRAYYLSRHPEKDGMLDMKDYEAYQQIELRGDDVTQFADSLLTARGESVRGSLSDKMQLLFGSEAETQLMRNIQMRDRGMALQWARVLKMSETSLRIVSPSIEEVRSQSGKTRYKVLVALAGEEPYEDGAAE